MPSNAFGFIALTHHKSCYVLQEYERNFSLITKLNKMGALVGRFTEQNSVVSNDSHWITPEMGKASDQGRSEFLFKLLKLTAINQSKNDLSYIVRLFRIGRNNSVNFFRRKSWITQWFSLH